MTPKRCTFSKNSTTNPHEKNCNLSFPPWESWKSNMRKGLCWCARTQLVNFLIQSAQVINHHFYCFIFNKLISGLIYITLILIYKQQLEVPPIVKYSALSLFAQRFYPILVSRYYHPSRFLLLFYIVRKSTDNQTLDLKACKF